MNQMPFKVKGMQRDLAESSFNSQYAYEIKNMRIMATNDNTLMSLVNEKGPKQLTITWHDGVEQTTNSFSGIPIGQAVINDTYVLFTIKTDTPKTDYIYKFWFEKDINNADVLHGKTLALGNFGFDVSHPIETLVFYENETIQKVYWVDGINQPRVINIAVNNTDQANSNVSKYDFIVKLSLTENVTVQKLVAANGVFPSGVIQYCFTYFNKFGQESNIFDTTPLQYISFSDRGGSPEENVGNAFTITINNISDNFDYIRIYSIHRTSINSTPIVKRLIDIEINGQSSIVYTDNGINGDIIDPKTLLYVGGEKIIAGTLNQKDNTLFLGDIKLARLNIDQNIKDDLRNSSLISYAYKSIYTLPNSTGFYPYINSLRYSSDQITTFKSREWYRFGVQFQHETGKWSEVIYVGDKQNDKSILSDSTVSLINTHLVKAQVTISSSIGATLISQGYKKVRGVVVYPTIADRSVICQGILNPTVYNVKDRFTNSPFAQASWFTRPMQRTTINPSLNEDYSYIPYGSQLEFRHNKQLAPANMRNGEIQNIIGDESPYISGNNPTNWVNINKHRYYVDQSIVTLHSPDVEFDDQLKHVDMSGVKLRIIGTVPITGTQTDINIQTSVSSTISNPFYNGITGTSNINKVAGFRGIVSGAFWKDKLFKPNTGYATKICNFPIYPWHRSSSLNNGSNPDETNLLTSVLDKKKMSNLRFSTFTEYSNTTQSYNIVTPVIFDSNEMSLIKLNSPGGGSPIINYYGNVDSISVNSTPYNIYITNDDSFEGTYIPLNTTYSNSRTSNDPIRIKYKSTPHVVIALNYTGGKQTILPALNNTNYGIDSALKPFWSTTIDHNAHIVLYYATGGNEPSEAWLGQRLIVDGVRFYEYVQNPSTHEYSWGKPTGDISIGDLVCYTNPQGIDQFYQIVREQFDHYEIVEFYDNLNIVQGTWTTTNNVEGQLYMGELYRETVSNRFGGTSPSAIANNTWLPAGPEVTLQNGSTTIVNYDQGDTYFQRYDHLKTYPFTMEDANSVVDIVSFMVETKVNIDGRYDKNRANTNNLTANPTTFNLLNPIYNQTNNFFVYRPLSSTISTESHFPNTITWSLTKSSAALTDAWTNITMASVLDLDGDKGAVNTIKRFNNELIAFQDKGISNILFNSRTQLSATDGVPIEIANSGKVDGKRYISDKTGCQNKWSIVESPLGLYFIDDINKSILLFNGQLQDISDDLGFHSWINDRSKEVGVWNPFDFTHVVGYYDKSNSDVLFISKDECLAFSEPLKTFSSFYSYNNTPFFMSIKDKGVWVNKSRSLAGGTTTDYMLWEHNKGEYNRFFDKSEDFYVTVIANAEPLKDKIFDVLEFRSDTFDETDVYQPFDTFDKLETWNEYQSGLQLLSNNKNKPSPLKKKFRIWRVNIPRDHNDGRSRMRNPWLFLKLSKQGSLCHHKTILHDLNVYYTI